SHGWTTKAPPDERGGNRYVRPTETAPHLDSTMDMMFRDDKCRIRTDHAPANFTTIKHMALNLIRRALAKILSASVAKSPPGMTTFSQVSSLRNFFTRFP